MNIYSILNYQFCQLYVYALRFKDRKGSSPSNAYIGSPKGKDCALMRLLSGNALKCFMMIDTDQKNGPTVQGQSHKGTLRPPRAKASPWIIEMLFPPHLIYDIYKYY